MLALDVHLDLDGSYSFYKKDLLRAFKEFPVTDKNAFYGLLLHYRLLLDYYIITIEEDSKGNRYEVLMMDNNDAERFSIKSLAQYQSMMYVSQTPLYNWLKPLLAKLRGYSPYTASAKEVLGWLKCIDDKTIIYGKREMNFSRRNQIEKLFQITYLGRIDPSNIYTHSIR